MKYVLLALCAATIAHAQSLSAYRVLGQRGFQANGVNMAQGVELNTPSAIALDTRGGRQRLYIADTANHRILGYEDPLSYGLGNAPSLILGQPNRQFTAPYGIGADGLNTPVALAVEPRTGHLYVADFNNNRILRFPEPFANPNRVEPDAAFGTPPTGSSISPPTKSALNRPRGLAFDSEGNLWIADTGNHRLVRIGSAALHAGFVPDFDTVLGQKDFVSNAVNGATGGVSAFGFDTPTALAFDAQDNLYVADFGNSRVLRFARPLGPANANPGATAVWGQPGFQSRNAPPQATPGSLAGPSGISLDAAGNLYVACANDHRVLLFPPNSTTAAATVLGQPDLTSSLPNAGIFPRARANTLYSPRDVRADNEGNVYVADAANHRVLLFPARTRSASLVWGQNDFTANAPNIVKASSIDAAAKMAIDYSSPPYALYVADTNNSRVLVWRDSTRFRDGDPADLVIGQPNFESSQPNADTAGVPARTTLARPAGLAVRADGTLYVADTGNNRVLRYPRPVDQGGRIVPDAVIGQTDFNVNTAALISATTLRAPTGLAFGPDGNLFIADTGNNRVLEFAAAAGTNSAALRVYGQPSMTATTSSTLATAQTLLRPRGLYVDAGYNLHVADSGSNRVVVFPNTQAAPASGMAAAVVMGQDSFSGNASGVLRTPTDIAADSQGNLYVADFGNNRVLVFPALIFLPPTGGAPTTVLGQKDLHGVNPNWDSANALATPNGLAAPLGIYVDRQDTLYVGDVGNNRVLHFLKATSFANAAVTARRGTPLAQGGVVTLFSNGLTEDRSLAPAVWSEKIPGEWPNISQQREVVLNDEFRIPVFHLNASQATFQLSQNTPLGINRVAVRTADTGELIAGGLIAVSATAPGLFTTNAEGQAVAFNEDGRANAANNPAIRGSVVTLLGTGQGQVSPAVLDGSAAPEAPLARTVTVAASDVRGCSAAQAMCVLIGNSFGVVESSVLAPGLVGIWQIKVKIPLDASAGGAVQVRAIINGAPSNTVSLAIR